MKISTSWINELLGRTMLNDQELAQALEQAGMEVEQISSSTPIDEKVIVAVVKKVVQHPGADRLKLAQVLTGSGEVGIVCGAPNLREGQKVALAQIGAVLPGGEKIQKAKLRGEVSEGMICSEFELGIGKDHNGILVLADDEVVGTTLCDLYPADSVIDLKTPANRFDVQSMWGLAREVAAMVDVQPVVPSPPPVSGSKAGPEVRPGALAGRYMLARVTVNQSSPSPAEVVARLRVSGMRSVSPVVDVTNYVMLETGQPLHAFDAAKVKLPLAVRGAQDGERLVTLDGVERKLTPEDVVIADASGPVALAGVMGGAASEVGADTKEILLESAAFDAVTVRKMAKRHGLRTEASARMERSLPVELPPIGLARGVELMQQWAGGKLVAVSDQLNVQPKPRRLELDAGRLSRLLGTEVTAAEAQSALKRLGIETEFGETSKGSRSKPQTHLVVVPEVPWWRPDLQLAEDLVEEVVRVIGYDRIPSTLPSWRPQRVVFDRVRSKLRRLREVLYGAGLFEVITYSFVSEAQLEHLGLEPLKHLKLRNPLSVEQAYLRSTLLPSHLAVLARNRGYAKSVGLYEMSNVFLKRGPGEQPYEPHRLAVTMVQPANALAQAKGVLDALARELNVPVRVDSKPWDVFVPGRSGEVVLTAAGKLQSVGRIGQLRPELLRRLKIDGEVAYAEVDLAPLTAAATDRVFAGVDRFPVIQRDVSVVLVNDVPWQAVADALEHYRVEYVGEYRGSEIPAGSRSLTLRFTLANPDRTPTEAEASELESTLLSRLERKFGAKRRD